MSNIASIGHNNPSEPIERQLPPPIMPGAILCTIPQAAAMVGRGQTWAYHAIATGLIEAVKSDGRTLVKIESVRRYVDELPPAKIKPIPKREPLRKRIA
jgi:hypothetical protein